MSFSSGGGERRSRGSGRGRRGGRRGRRGGKGGRGGRRGGNSSVRLNTELLERLFAGVVEKPLIGETLRRVNGDMQLAIDQLTVLGGPPHAAVLAAEAPQPLESSLRLASDDDASCVEDVVGDLFACPSSAALGHCVSRDLAMGKGIAVLFKKQFKRVKELEAQGREVGEVATLDVAIEDGGVRYVYYLISKERYFHKPTYDALRMCLLAVRSHAMEHGVQLVCFPRIGCGLDGLIYQYVRAMLVQVFSGSGVRVQVYTLPPRS